LSFLATVAMANMKSNAERSVLQIGCSKVRLLQPQVASDSFDSILSSLRVTCPTNQKSEK
jgi:hypothetical protein